MIFGGGLIGEGDERGKPVNAERGSIQFSPARLDFLNSSR